jgi:predicted nucleic acid-binding protein
LELSVERVLGEDLENRILDFDTAAARAAATLKGLRKLAGKPVEIRDTQIAGIVLARSATLVTRNVRDFADLDVPVINPWASG